MKILLIAAAVASGGGDSKAEVVKPYKDWLAKVRNCETNNRNISDASGTYHGYYQFDMSSWQGAGGKGNPRQADRTEQDYRAVKWRLKVGKGAWPNCS